VTASFFVSFCYHHQGPEPPWDLKVKNSETTEVTLEWKEPKIDFPIRGVTNYTVS